MANNLGICKKKLKQMVILCVRVMGKCWSCVKINI